MSVILEKAAHLGISEGEVNLIIDVKRTRLSNGDESVPQVSSSDEQASVSEIPDDINPVSDVDENKKEEFLSEEEKEIASGVLKSVKKMIMAYPPLIFFAPAFILFASGAWALAIILLILGGLAHYAYAMFMGNDSDGCFIATAVYGDYDHPQVLKLRHFRDSTLRKSLLGRCFISFYYSVGPHLAILPSKSTKVRSLLRALFDRL